MNEMRVWQTTAMIRRYFGQHVRGLMRERIRIRRALDTFGGSPGLVVVVSRERNGNARKGEIQ